MAPAKVTAMYGNAGDEKGIDLAQLVRFNP
jgi:hypothetical protein